MKKFWRFRATLLVALALEAARATAQIDNRAFSTPLAIDSSQVRQLRVRAEALFFNKDNEYFGKIADGYTLFGVAARPQLTWQPTARVKLAAGVFFRQDFGNSRLQQIRPALTLVYQTRNARFLFGALDGHLHHALAEPLYDFERVLTRRQEEGMQYVADLGRLRFDAWIDWERMQYARDSVQEQVAGGFSGLLDVVGGHRQTSVPGASLWADDPAPGRRFGLRVPVQFTGKHIGGQLDTVERPLQTYFNGATGLRGVWRFDSTAFMRGLRLEALGVGFLDYSFTRRLPYPSGRGVLLTGGFETKLGTLWASYWRGDGYAADAGGALYQSIGTTVKNPGYTERHRELIIVRLSSQLHLWPGGMLVSRFEPYYDLRNRAFEFNLGLYVTGLLDERVAGR